MLEHEAEREGDDEKTIRYNPQIGAGISTKSKGNKANVDGGTRRRWNIRTWESGRR